MVFTAQQFSASANILSIILSNKELARIEFPVTDGVSVLSFDVIENITHNMNATITQNPVEDGSDITDNIKIENKKASFDITISDTPLVGLATASNLFGRVSTIAQKVRKVSSQIASLGAGTFLQKTSQIAGSVVDGSFIRSQDTFDLLEKLHNNKILITAVIGFRRYTNAVISSINVVENLENENSLVANISIEEIEIVKTSTTLIPESTVEESVSHTATDVSKTGKQGVSSAPTTVQEPASILFNLFKGLGG